jgi:hypothetical protein
MVQKTEPDQKDDAVPVADGSLAGLPDLGKLILKPLMATEAWSGYGAQPNFEQAVLLPWISLMPSLKWRG